MFLGMAAGVVVARSLGPEVKGQAAILTAAAQTLFMFANLGLGSAFSYYIAKRLYESRQVMSMAWASTLVLGGGTWGLFVVTWPWHSTLWEGIPRLLVFAGVGSLLTSVLALYLVRIALGYGFILTMNASTLIRAGVFLAGLVFLVGVAGYGLIGYVGALYLASIAELLVLCVSLRGDMVPAAFWRSGLIRSSLSYGVKSHALIVMTFLNLRIDLFLLMYFADATAVGFYSLGVGMAELAWLVPNATVAPLFTQVAQADAGHRAVLTLRTCRWSMAFLLLVALGGILFGRPFIALLYGRDFLPAYGPFLWLLPGICLFPIYKLLNVDLAARGCPGYGTIASLSALVTNIAANVLLIPSFGINGAAMATSISYSVMAMISLRFFLRVTSHTLRDVFYFDRDECEFVFKGIRKGTCWFQRMNEASVEINRTSVLPASAPGDSCSPTLGEAPCSTDSDRGAVRIPIRVMGCMFRSDVQPVSVGVPLPRGSAHACARWMIAGGPNGTIPVQTSALSFWPDGSVRWLLAEFNASPETQTLSELHLCHQPVCDTLGPTRAMVAREHEDAIALVTGKQTFHVPRRGSQLIESGPGDVQSWLGSDGIRIIATDTSGRQHTWNVERLAIGARGELTTTVTFDGWSRALRLRCFGTIRFYASSGLVRLELTVHNPARAKHTGGYWDLGDPGSVLLRDLSVEIHTAFRAERRVAWRETPTSETLAREGADLTIYQDSSGGENWSSRNHLNRHGEVPLRFRGYRGRCGSEEFTGHRATPVVALMSGDRSIACAPIDFWQKFPGAIETEGSTLRVRLLPQQFSDLHEIQAGEQLTRVIWLQFGERLDDPCEHLAWAHEPPQVQIDPQWIAESRTVPFFSAPSGESPAEHGQIQVEALEGPRNFFAKREAIDEYGWRNYGDVWADHEEAYCDDPKPVISHYNNQYDLLYGFLIQYLRTGDNRWWELGDPLARHILDIDIYHTARDKAAYSGGLFWHTAHYHDAGTATHRSMSRTMRGKKIPAPGGGPASEHNYTSGLLLYHYLTGDPRARDAVIGLGEWVSSMDDGTQHPFGLFCDEPTGLASATAEITYHGPGRGAGNSINALLDAWLLTDELRYLEKCHELICRTVHPTEDIDARDLLNAELRWSYTVYLQVLAKYLDVADPSGAGAEMWFYVRDSLLHYARWMLSHERLYLDHADELEFPTETWAAQDLRKAKVLMLAGAYATDSERVRFERRGQEMLGQAERQIRQFMSRDMARPLAIRLQQAAVDTRQAFSVRPGSRPLGEIERRYAPARPCFHPQKAELLRRTRSIKGLFSLGMTVLQPSRWIRVASRSWWCQRLWP